MTPAQQRSATNKKAARSRKRCRKAREGTLACQAPSHIRPRGATQQRVLDETQDGVSSGVIAAKLGVSAAYVRAVWRRNGQPPRTASYWPRVSLKATRLLDDID